MFTESGKSALKIIRNSKSALFYKMMIDVYSIINNKLKRSLQNSKMIVRLNDFLIREFKLGSNFFKILLYAFNFGNYECFFYSHGISLNFVCLAKPVKFHVIKKHILMQSLYGIGKICRKERLIF